MQRNSAKAVSSNYCLGVDFHNSWNSLGAGLPWKLGTLFAYGRTDTPLLLDHTIVPAYDKVKPAEFIARIFGLKYEGPGDT